MKRFVERADRGQSTLFPECLEDWICEVAVDTEHHLIVAHEVTNSGSDRSQLANIASQAKEVLGAEHLDAVADRGYFNSPEILACEQANITVTLPKLDRGVPPVLAQVSVREGK